MIRIYSIHIYDDPISVICKKMMNIYVGFTCFDFSLVLRHFMIFHKERRDLHEPPVNPTRDNPVSPLWPPVTEVDHLSMAAKEKKPTTANSWASKIMPQIHSDTSQLSSAIISSLDYVL